MFWLYVSGICCLFGVIQNVTPASLPSGLVCRQPGNRSDDYTFTPGMGGHKVHTWVTTWKEAKGVCRNEGGHLAIINSEAEANVIAALFNKSERQELSYNPDYFWIGTLQLHNEQGNWETIHGGSLAQAGFNEWHDLPGPVGPHCGTAHRDGNLSWFGCLRVLGFVCEVPYVECGVQNDVLPSPPALAPRTSAPPASVQCTQPVNRRDDYTYIPRIGAYKLHTRAVIWNEARITCEEEGGYLAIINSIAEANAISEVFANSEEITGSPHPDFASIGFHDFYSEGQFITIHGQTLAKAGFTRWANGQPDNAGGAENCGSFHKSGRLNDIGCGAKSGFICEIPITKGEIPNLSAN